MERDQVPPALEARLGDEATVGLLQLLDRSHREAREDVIIACTERFERRVVEEVSGLRLEIAQVESRIRHDMAKLESGIRGDMAKLESGIRNDMAKLEGGIRQDMSEMRAGLREDIAASRVSLGNDIGAGRVELFKWCFLFWIGQVLAISGVVGVMLRVMR